MTKGQLRSASVGRLGREVKPRAIEAENEEGDVDEAEKERKAAAATKVSPPRMSC